MCFGREMCRIFLLCFWARVKVEKRDSAEKGVMSHSHLPLPIRLSLLERKELEEQLRDRLSLIFGFTDTVWLWGLDDNVWSWREGHSPHCCDSWLPRDGSSDRAHLGQTSTFATGHHQPFAWLRQLMTPGEQELVAR